MRAVPVALGALASIWRINSSSCAPVARPSQMVDTAAATVPQSGQSETWNQGSGRCQDGTLGSGFEPAMSLPIQVQRIRPLSLDSLGFNASMDVRHFIARLGSKRTEKR